MNAKNLFFFALGIAIALAIPSAVAAPKAVFNDPYSGYVLCVSKSTKLVTYPAKLKCPSGYKKLELGAQGPEGPSGPSGVSQIKWAQSSTFDLVVDGWVSSSQNMSRRVLMHIDGDSVSNSVGNAYVSYSASVRGNWSDSASDGSLIQCYFQSPSDYNANSENSYWGKSEDEYTNWNSIHMTVKSSYIAEWADVYLVCRTSGTVRNLRAYVEAIAVDSIGDLGLLPNP